MSESRGFFSRLFLGDKDEGETQIYSAAEVGAGEPKESRKIEQHPQGFTVERAAEIISDLPPDVSRESAVRIVRGTLTAAGIKVEDLERSTRARETKLRSEIELARSRREELKERTEEVVRSLEEEIRKAREARDNGVAEEEEKISRANLSLEDIRRVRGFFDFPGEESEETTHHEEATYPVGDETQVLEPFDADQTQVLRRPGPLAEPDSATEER